MTIIDAIMRATAERIRVRLITDRAEADRLGMRVGDQVIEREPRKFEPSGLQ